MNVITDFRISRILRRLVATFGTILIDISSKFRETIVKFAQNGVIDWEPATQKIDEPISDRWRGSCEKHPLFFHEFGLPV